VNLPITFYTFKANMDERDSLKDYITSLDGVGSIYFNFETQKVLGLIATTRVIKDIKPNATIEKVSQGVQFEDYSKNSKNSDLKLIEEMKYHWVFRQDEAESTMAGFTFFIKHDDTVK
jgi:hypothetical protein